MTKRLIWVVTPHENGEYDECWLPHGTDEDDDDALAYAVERLENAWDQNDPGVVGRVTIERRWIDEDEYREWHDS